MAIINYRFSQSKSIYYLYTLFANACKQRKFERIISMAAPLIAGQKQLLELAGLSVQWRMFLFGSNIESTRLLTGMIRNSPPHLLLDAGTGPLLEYYISCSCQ